MRLSKPLTAVLFLTPLTLLALAGPAGARAACFNWTGEPALTPGDESRLRGVAVPSACTAWAVGSYISPGGRDTMIQRWNGFSWTQETTPNPGGTSNDGLHGVAATSNRNAWAVGYYNDSTNDRTLVLHWDGSSWTQQTSPNRGPESNSLQAVAATSADNAWAVGDRASTTSGRSLILRWNGNQWRSVAHPNPGGDMNYDYLAAVAATSRRNAWAVGTTQTNLAGSSQTLILHWNGTKWRRVPSPNPGGDTREDHLLGVVATSADNAWAVGTYDSASRARTLILHWNGRSWKHVPSPNPGGPGADSELNAVTALSPRNAWAVGYFRGAADRQTLALRWNGNAWKRVKTPSVEGFDNTFAGVHASSAENVWAVGSYEEFTDEWALAFHCC